MALALSEHQATGCGIPDSLPRIHLVRWAEAGEEALEAWQLQRLRPAPGMLRQCQRIDCIIRGEMPDIQVAPALAALCWIDKVLGITIAGLQKPENSGLTRAGAAGVRDLSRAFVPAPLMRRVEALEFPGLAGPWASSSSAPYPLAYFTSALTACVMVQLRAFARRMRIEVQDINVNTRCHWERVQQGSAPYVSAPVAFTMDIELGPDVTGADQRRLLAAAEKGCFIEAALKPGVMRHRLKIKDRWVEVRSAP